VAVVWGQSQGMPLHIDREIETRILCSSLSDNASLYRYEYLCIKIHLRLV
jgi:hypothetical protein